MIYFISYNLFLFQDKIRKRGKMGRLEWWLTRARAWLAQHYNSKVGSANVAAVAMS